jgi:hypothetical protein
MKRNLKNILRGNTCDKCLYCITVLHNMGMDAAVGGFHEEYLEPVGHCGLKTDTRGRPTERSYINDIHTFSCEYFLRNNR